MISCKFTKVYTDIDSCYIIRSGDDREERVLEEGHPEITQIDDVVSGNEIIEIVNGQPRLIDNHQQILAERQWQQIRIERNRLLDETDWTQLADVSFNEETKLNYRKYRQGLRDITNQQDPFNINWPIL